MIEKDVFKGWFKQATVDAIKCGQLFIKQDLYKSCLYDVYLNYSFDEELGKESAVYEEDDNKVMLAVSEKEVVECLYRQNRVPQWIDISVERLQKNTTIIKLLCCGRYVNNEKILYYYGRGAGPFGVKSPNLPPDYTDGEKFEIPQE